MKLSIIIVSYNTKALLKRCLESLPKSNDVQIIVVDNASTDGSAKLATIKNSRNLGFAAANNQGIKRAQGEYILLLNSDTQVKPGAVDKLVQFMDTHPRAGVASAQLLNPAGSIQPSGGYLPRLSNIMAWMLFIDDLPWIKPWFWSYHLERKHFYRVTRPIGWVQGAAMLLRRSMLDRIGALDENIFMYGEDVDLCLRAREAGWQVWTVAEAQIIHHEFRSGSKAHAIVGEYQGLKYLFTKHKPTWEQPLLKFLLAIGAMLRFLLFGTILRQKATYDIYRQAFNLARQ